MTACTFLLGDFFRTPINGRRSAATGARVGTNLGRPDDYRRNLDRYSVVY